MWPDRRVAEQLVEELRLAGLTAATAESLTGGLVGAAITAVPGASAVYRGGLIAYATEVKGALAGVPAEVLARSGAVSAATAECLARAAADRCGADVAVALTGVAGPDAQEGHPPGTIWLGLAWPGGVAAERVSLSAEVVRAGRDAVRASAAERAMVRLAGLVRVQLRHGGGGCEAGALA